MAGEQKPRQGESRSADTLVRLAQSWDADTLRRWIESTEADIEMWTARLAEFKSLLIKAGQTP